jgi:hypothetical protein
MLHGVVRHAGYPFHSPVAPSFPLPHVAMYHVILIVLYLHELHGGKIISTLILFRNYAYFDLIRVSGQQNPLQLLLNFARITNSCHKTK